jgi:hypothetical protein
MTYWYPRRQISPGWTDFFIVNVETRCVVGVAVLHGSKYRVEDLHGRVVAEVNYLNDAGPALADYHDKHAKWEPENYDIVRLTRFGELLVTRKGDRWFVQRFDQTLMFGDELADFATPAQAKRAAVTYAGRLPIGPEGTSEGYYWLAPCPKSLPGYIDYRTHVEGRVPVATVDVSRLVRPAHRS